MSAENWRPFCLGLNMSKMMHKILKWLHKLPRIGRQDRGLSDISHSTQNIEKQQFFTQETLFRSFL